MAPAGAQGRLVLTLVGTSSMAAAPTSQAGFGRLPDLRVDDAQVRPVSLGPNQYTETRSERRPFADRSRQRCTTLARPASADRFLAWLRRLVDVALEDGALFCPSWLRCAGAHSRQ